MEVVTSVKDHLENKGYTVTTSPGPYGLGEELLAVKDKDKFFIEAIGETAHKKGPSIVYAIGKIIKRMNEQGFWVHYGIAIPKNYYAVLKDFEPSGFEVLKLHLFLVENFYELVHLDPKETVELIQQLKAGRIVHLTAWGVEYGLP